MNPMIKSDPSYTLQHQFLVADYGCWWQLWTLTSQLCYKHKDLSSKKGCQNCILFLDVPKIIVRNKLFPKNVRKKQFLSLMWFHGISWSAISFCQTKRQKMLTEWVFWGGVVGKCYEFGVKQCLWVRFGPIVMNECFLITNDGLEPWKLKRLHRLLMASLLSLIPNNFRLRCSIYVLY